MNVYVNRPIIVFSEVCVVGVLPGFAGVLSRDQKGSCGYTQARVSALRRIPQRDFSSSRSHSLSVNMRLILDLDVFALRRSGEQ